MHCKNIVKSTKEKIKFTLKIITVQYIVHIGLYYDKIRNKSSYLLATAVSSKILGLFSPVSMTNGFFSSALLKAEKTHFFTAVWSLFIIDRASQCFL